MENMQPFKVKVNDFEFDLAAADVNEVDIIKKSPLEFNLIKNNQSINAKLIEVDPTGKKMKIEVGGESFYVEIKDALQQMLDKMGFGISSNKHIKEIKAPMPGLVLEIAVSEGQEVQEGDKILILEAMKMENSIIINSQSIIKRIAVKTGQAVDKGQLLVELE